MPQSVIDSTGLPRYRPQQTYLENYHAAPNPVIVDVPPVSGHWKYCGLDVDSPLGIPAGPLLNGKWCQYYASLGFDVLTYKTVRSVPRDCYPVPNLVPIDCEDLHGDESRLPETAAMKDSWAVSFGMPSMSPDVWQADVRATRNALPPGKILSVSVVGSVQPGWTIYDLANDYAQCARWAVESGADTIEANFSCPNVATQDGQLCQTPTEAVLVADTIRSAIGSTPLIIKIGHVEPTLIPLLVEELAPSVNALSMTNSVAATIVDRTGHLLFDGQKRGICGNGCRKVSLDQVRLVKTAIQSAGLNMEIIGVGGAFNADHVQQYLDAGASAVQMATAAMLDPMVAVQIKSQL